jgi:hypothetical protein
MDYRDASLYDVHAADDSPPEEEPQMSRVVRVVIALGGLALVIAGASQFWHGWRGLAAGDHPTVVTDARLTAIKQAADDFLTIAKGSETSGQPPRESDPKVKALLDTVFDTAVLNTAQPLPQGDLDNLNEWLSQGLRVATIYIFAGAGYSEYSQVGKLDAAAQQKLGQQVAHNTVAFAPEMGRYMDAQLYILGAIAWCMSADLTSEPDEYKSTQAQNGLAKIRNGVVQTLTGVLTTLPMDGLSDTWRRDRLGVLTAITPKVVAFLLPDQRKTVHDTAVQVAAQMTDATVKNGLNDFARTVGG